MSDASASHRFSAYSNLESRSHAHSVPDATDFMDAAVLFAERWASTDGEVSVTVVDCDTGEQQCFHIDLGSGEAAPC